MAKRVSDVQRTVNFYQTGDLATVNTTNEIVQTILKNRNGVVAKPKVAKKAAKPAPAPVAASTEVAA